MSALIKGGRTTTASDDYTGDVYIENDAGRFVERARFGKELR